MKSTFKGTSCVSGGTSVKQPLVTRPAYGYGRPAMPMGESKLPSGGPSDKGLPVDPGIPGSSTYAKPEDDIREQRKDDEPIKRVDDADDLLKDRDRVDTKEDWAQEHDAIGEMGKGEWDTTIKTKYPYRDDRPNKHYASAEFVMGMYLVAHAHDFRVDLDDSQRTAATIAEVSRGLSPKVQQKARSCAATLKRADIGNLRWIFSVNCGNGAKVVRLKASRKQPNVIKLVKMDVMFSCSCPAWQWLGPEHNAQQGGYLDGKPRGTAMPPNVKDPRRHNRVCKHVASVIRLVRNWDIPTREESQEESGTETK